ncbi:MAG: hypothetical protein M1831_002765 [Alyxoria varia]|nr:MAG: hypothetical protein M1831_002765 [Alyxoria varia]
MKLYEVSMDVSVVRDDGSAYALLVPKIEANNVKLKLKSQNLLSEHLKIVKPESTEPSQDDLLIRTNLTYANELEDLRQFGYPVVIDRHRGSRNHDKDKLRDSIRQSFECLPRGFVTSIEVQFSDLVLTLNSSYCVYRPLLLLSTSAVANPTWRTFLSALSADKCAQAHFFARLAKCFDVTHVAIDGPIAASFPGVGNEIASQSVENFIRLPTNLRPLHGDFGPDLAPFPEHIPDSSDYDKAFWVSTKQNGITQTWAPRYTMFSAGNVTEKARLIQLESVHSAIVHGIRTGGGCTAVDLFAGIGYFAFSYAKAGFSHVLCWDLNPWSVEGMRRGSVANKWQYSILSDRCAETSSGGGLETLPYGGTYDTSKMSPTLLIFNESNEKAIDRIASLENRLPPIRHVNCGMLPTSSAAWKTALRALNRRLGGYLHLHETVLQKDLDAKVKKIVKQTTELAQRVLHTESTTFDTRLEHVEMVKTVGPKLLHIVVDIAVLPN